MATNIQIIQQAQSWYVVSAEGRVGPLDSEDEALAYAELLQRTVAAGSETACTEAECLV